MTTTYRDLVPDMSPLLENMLIVYLPSIIFIRFEPHNAKSKRKSINKYMGS